MQREAARAYGKHRQVEDLRAQAARLQQQKEVAERLATELVAETAAMRAQLDKAVRARAYYEQLSEQRLGEVLWLRREMDTHWRGLVRKELAAAVETTGEACALPLSLFPLLAEEQKEVAPAALQRRAARLAAGDGMHPDVDQYGVGGMRHGVVDHGPTLARLAAATTTS